MDSERQEFERNLDELIRLFRMLKDKTSIENIPGVDKAMYKNFEVFLNNYDNMKDHITDNLYEQFGEPMRKMITDLVSQLKNELTEEEIIEFENSIKVEDGNFEVDNVTEVDNLKDIEEIDKLLKNPELSLEEIDILLDKRSSLKNK